MVKTIAAAAGHNGSGTQTDNTTKRPKAHPNLAESKRLNDPHAAVYANEDVDALQRDANKSLGEMQKHDRKETHLQIANIVARHYLLKLEGETSPVKLYDMDNGVLKLNRDRLLSLVGAVYDTPYMPDPKAPDTMIVDKMKHRAQEARIRTIAPIVYKAVTENIVMTWSKSQGCLMVPRWCVTTDKEGIDCAQDPNHPDRHEGALSKLVALDGSAGRTVAELAKRLAVVAKKPRQQAATATANNTTPNNAGSKPSEEQVRTVLNDTGLSKSLSFVVSMLAAAKDGPFPQDIVESVLVAYDHIVQRNGQAALEKARKALAHKEDESA